MGCAPGLYLNVGASTAMAFYWDSDELMIWAQVNFDFLRICCSESFCFVSSGLIDRAM